MRISPRLLLIGLVAACAPMVPPPPGTDPTPAAPEDVAPQPGQPTAPPSEPAPGPSEPAPYDDGSFQAWKQGFLARHGGANRAAFERELEGLTPNPDVIRLDRNQPEFSRPVGSYIANAVSAGRISEGRTRSLDVPWEATATYGVPAEILVSIWAMESGFGSNQGSMDVIRSLATLAYDGRRRDWAEGQLRDALRIVVEGRRARSGLKGSWAGAMGQTQFMPDNYLRLGQDGNGDGVVDIWGSNADALMSAAHLLGNAGWKRGQGWAHEVILPLGFDYSLAEADRHPWSYWAARGVTLPPGASLNEAEQAEGATILLPQGARGPAFLALPNHYAIRRYNNSVAYALAVGLMADGVMGKPALIRPWPDDAALSRDQRMGAQRALAALGYDPGGIDGVIGSGTRSALRKWQIATGEIPDGYLSGALADRLIALTAQ